MKLERMCVVCRTRRHKSELTRVAYAKDGRLALDDEQKAMGRGAYICSKECSLKAQKSKVLNRAFKKDVGSDIYIALIEAFSEVL